MRKLVVEKAVYPIKIFEDRQKSGDTLSKGTIVSVDTN